jgi:serpin B
LVQKTFIKTSERQIRGKKSHRLASANKLLRSLFESYRQVLKGTVTMQSLLSKSSIKALVASLIVLIMCATLALTGASGNSRDTVRPQPEGAGGNMVDDRLHSATSRFAFKLYDKINKQPAAENTFVSPASVMLALAMTYNGADGTTRQEMARALEIEGMSLDEVNHAFANLKSALNPTDPKVQLKIANSLWAQKGFALRPAFIKRSKDYFEAEITSLDFADPAAPQTINSWVKKNTEGKIEKILDEIRGNAVLFLINAIYFKGQWQFEFKKENTKPDVFRLPGDKRKEVPMMSQSGSYLYYKGKDFQSVVLPYGQGSVSMYIFLPDEQIRLDRFEQNLTTENWDMWMKSFQLTPGDLMLPRFKVEWESELNDALIALGMGEAFNQQRANFSQIAEVNSGNRLYISQVKHKSWAEVNEEGTEAAAVTSVGISVTSVQRPREKFVMKVDRPFFFAIRDNRTGVLLFMGSISNPG